MGPSPGWFIRGERPHDESGLTRKKKLREAQKEAENFIAGKSDEWMGRVLTSRSDIYEPKEILCSAYDCFDFDLPLQSAEAPAEKYDYDVSKERKWFNPRNTISVNRNPVQEQMHQTISGMCPTLQSDIQEIRLPKASISMTGIGSLCQNAWDPTCDSCEDSTGSFKTHPTRLRRKPQSARPRGRFVSYSHPGSFSLEKRDPHWIERNKEYYKLESDWNRLKSDEAFRLRRIKHLAMREENLTKLRNSMKQRFHKALVQNEPFARKRFDDYLQKYFVSICQKSGRRCNVSLEDTFAAKLNTTLGSTNTPVGDTVLSMLSASDPIYRNESLAMKKRKRSRGSLLIPAPPVVNARRDSAGRLLPASQLRPPRPAKLLSENSEKIIAKIGRKPYSSSCALTPSWELTPEETIDELNNFDSRVNITT